MQTYIFFYKIPNKQYNLFLLLQDNYFLIINTILTNCPLKYLLHTITGSPIIDRCNNDKRINNVKWKGMSFYHTTKMVFLDEKDYLQGFL